ncbi:putative -beta-glucan synthase component gls1 protein [Phaeoacremonium minimum UCRPA7]|uniref:Putative-beta-glucan synthase component gls1 protein n=1 Tax=Phaeoacremonium minimum (strain UCR-PA7) TaxID=1286976 RepID=R8BSQ8_PHAM7|nr:putative -beta-glucan synthase component gls1 protein [Phaeoacremonium minimum UCRPA7]EOO02412.1 putative -beta-glucan synthase component gls1 protein [Phaeoacremonium minimum UCRPA7]
MGTTMSYTNNPYYKDGGYYEGYDQRRDENWSHDYNKYGQEDTPDSYGKSTRWQTGSQEELETGQASFMRSHRAMVAQQDDGYYDEQNSSYYGDIPPAFRDRAFSQTPETVNRSSRNSILNEQLDYNNATPFMQRLHEPYPAWTSDGDIPLTKEEIEQIFVDLTDKASRMTPNQSLLSLHADYIGGDNANYKKWYFAAFRGLDRGTGSSKSKKAKAKKAGKKPTTQNEVQDDTSIEDDDDSLETAESRWKSRMNHLSQYDRTRQLALYLLCWGEANQVRFMPEALCFIYKCAEDYLNSAAYDRQVERAEDYSYLNNVITPLYQYCRDQGYEILDGVYVRREKDHHQIIGYDDCNQLFWYPEGIERIILEDKTRLIDLPSAERYINLKGVNWKKCFFKTYRETRSWSHLLTNFNRIWVIHICMFWFYTAHNAPTLLVHNYEQQVNQQPPASAQLSIVALGGGLAALIQILATLAEWTFVPRRWPGAENLTVRLVVLIVVLIINIAPSVYIFMPASNDAAYQTKQESKIAHILGVVQFLIAIGTYIWFSIMPLRGLFGNFFIKAHKHTASKSFTASFPALDPNDRVVSFGLWLTVFGAKFGESYVYLTLSIRDPIRYLSIMDVSTCLGDSIIGNVLCKRQPTILLILMIVTDLVFFFLDTYLWKHCLDTMAKHILTTP